MNRLALVAYSCALCIIYAGQAWADISDIRNADNVIALNLGISDLKYGETMNGKTFDTENGSMPSFGLSGTHVSSGGKKYGGFFDNIYLNFDFRDATGSDTYR